MKRYQSVLRLNCLMSQSQLLKETLLHHGIREAIFISRDLAKIEQRAKDALSEFDGVAADFAHAKQAQLRAKKILRSANAFALAVARHNQNPGVKGIEEFDSNDELLLANSLTAMLMKSVKEPASLVCRCLRHFAQKYSATKSSTDKRWLITLSAYRALRYEITALAARIAEAEMVLQRETGHIPKRAVLHPRSMISSSQTTGKSTKAA
jgi:hypothetical protein